MQHSQESISEKVLQIIADVAGKDLAEIRRETELITDLNLDSLAIYEIVIELEEYYDLQISDEHIERLRTVGDAVDYLVSIVR